MQTADQLAKLKEWKDAAHYMQYYKAEEARLRKEYAALIGKNSPGTHNIPIDDKHVAKLVIRETVSITKDADIPAICARMINEGLDPLLVNRVFKWEPKFSEAEYKQLPDKFRKIAEEVLISKPSMPTLEIVQPKQVA